MATETDNVPDFTEGSITHKSKYGKLELRGVYLWAAALLVLAVIL